MNIQFLGIISPAMSSLCHVQCALSLIDDIFVTFPLIPTSECHNTCFKSLQSASQKAGVTNYTAGQMKQTDVFEGIHVIMKGFMRSMETHTYQKAHRARRQQDADIEWFERGGGDQKN